MASAAMKTIAGTAEDHVVAIAFSPNAYGAVEELMQRSGIGSLSRVLMEAIAFEKWYRDTVAAGNRVLVDHGKGDYREVRRT